MIRLEVLADAEELAELAAARIQAAAAEAVAGRGSFVWAVSGGTTPLATFRRLELPWAVTTTFQVDERIAPTGHPDRNLTGALAALPPAAAETVRPMSAEWDDADEAAAAYAASLPDRFDVVQLGLGDDGHTASLVPRDPVLAVRDRDVAVTGEYQGRRRITLTYPPLDRARQVLWIVEGASKAAALAQLLDRDRSIPAGRVAASDQVVLADRAAASR